MAVMRRKLKTKIHRIYPNQIKIRWLTPTGDVIRDSSVAVCRSHLWEAEFIGVDINPAHVKRITFPEINYDESKPYQVIVEEIIDERVVVKGKGA